MKFIDKVYNLDEIKSNLIPVFKEYNITKAVIFGSYAKSNAVPGDDLDLVLSADRTLGLEEYYKFVRDLHHALQIRIDVTFEDYLNPFIEQDVQENSVVIYEK